MFRARVIAIVLFSFCINANLLIADTSSSLKSAHAVEVDSNQPFPSVMFSDILKSMSDQVLWETGQLRFFERVRMTFLPEFTDPQHIAGYNANTGAFLVSQLTTENGAVVADIFWEARQDRFPYWTASAVNNSDPKPLSPGKYSLKFMIDGQPFWGMSFEVTSDSGANAYEKGHSYLEGPWEEWAYIYVPNGNLSQTPSFNLFIRDRDARPGSWAKKNVEIEVIRDGERVAQHGIDASTDVPTSELYAKPWWIAHELSLRNPDNNGSVTAGQILEAGDYLINVRINGEHYASYRYRADGALPATGRGDRNTADPMSFLEGATDRFYLQKIQE